MALRHLLHLSLRALSVIAVAFPSQQVLSPAVVQNGLLRRFQPDDSHTLNQILGLAQVRLALSCGPLFLIACRVTYSGSRVGHLASR